MKKAGVLVLLIISIMLLSSSVLAYDAINSTTSTVYILNSAPVVRILTATGPAEVGVTTTTITANITDPNGIPGDFGTVFATYNDGSTDVQTVYLNYNAASKLYENDTYQIPAASNIGTWTVTVNGTDTGGLSDENSTTFTVQDTVSPIVSDLLPANSTNYPVLGTDIDISIVIVDNGTIHTAYVTVVGPDAQLPINVTLIYNGSSGRYEGTLTGATYTNDAGIYNLTTFVNDTGTNTGNIVEGFFYVGDVEDPVITNINDAPDPVDSGQTINFTANVTDNVGVYEVWVGIEGANYTMTCTGAVDDKKCYYDIFDTYITPGTYNYTIYANDTSGNDATPSTSDFTVNTLISITLTQVPIDFGNTTVPITDRRADNGTAGSGYAGGTVKGFPAFVNNTGNVNINLSINGTELVGQTTPSYTVGVGNVTYDIDDNIAGGSALTTTETEFATLIGMTTKQDVYFWISLPEGLVSQNYQGTVNIYATQS